MSREAVTERVVWECVCEKKRQAQLARYDFARGLKTTEYRRRGTTWNAETCWIGREVILSCGYGRARRLEGRIVGFHYDTTPNKLPGWVECYGRNAGDAACIKIEVFR